MKVHNDFFLIIVEIFCLIFLNKQHRGIIFCRGNFKCLCVYLFSYSRFCFFFALTKTKCKIEKKMTVKVFDYVAILGKKIIGKFDLYYSSWLQNFFFNNFDLQELMAHWLFCFIFKYIEQKMLYQSFFCNSSKKNVFFRLVLN